MNYHFIRNTREYELEEIMCLFPQGSSILEIGAGAGWQAEVIAEKGFQIEAIDVERSNYHEHQSWPVIQYDGMHIPFPDNQFDIVFSSNVLEHIDNIEEFQSEIRRVLKPKGIAIHILPSGSWRFWTIISRYPNLIKSLIKTIGTKVISIFHSTKSCTESDTKTVQRKESYKTHPLKSFIKLLLPTRHGRRGNFFTEVFFFSRFYWIPFFNRTGWRMKTYYPNKLFYTGNIVFGALLGIKIRHYMSYILGSSCMIYILEPLSSIENSLRRNIL